MGDFDLHLHALQIALAFVAGLVLGAFHFVGLWLTLRRLSGASRPQTLLLASLLVRFAVVVVGFYLVMQNDWQRLVACLLGFLLTRTVLVRYWGTDRTAL